ncbi:peptidoglycan DD-metalloendopeptidase family protein [Leucobacter sp. GX24907]
MASSAHRGHTTARRLLAGTLIAAVFGLGFAGTDLTVSASPAQGVDQSLPTWDDVQKAKQSQSSASAKVTEIEGLIKDVEKQVEETRQEAADAATAAADRHEELQTAAQRADKLVEEAKRSKKLADETAEQAAGLVGQMYRSGGVDRNVELFLEDDGDTADTLLERLALLSKATERNTSISEEAQQAMNTAASLGDQAEEAVAERDRLYEEAEAENQRAQQVAEEKRLELIEQEDQLTTLETQLEALKDKTTKTVKGYEERLRQEEEARRKAEEAARRAAEEAARRAAEEAARNGGGGGGGGTGGGGGGGGGGTAPPPSTGGGWGKPLSSYWVSTEWWGYEGHTGIDLATGAGSPIYAVGAGTVTFSGWWPYCGGNMVKIDHGGGFETWYAHQNSAPIVANGQRVGAGQLLGYVGATGCATGPHLHFATLQYGQFVPPRPPMAARGVYF